MTDSDVCGTQDLAHAAGVSRQMIAKWSREGLEEAAKVSRGKWDRERALSWINDRREDSLNLDGRGVSSGDLAAVRIRLYGSQADGQDLRNEVARANLVYRDRAQGDFADCVAEQIADGDAWARDATTPACEPLLKHVSAAVVIAIKTELWNEQRARQAGSIRRVARNLAVGEDVGSARIRLSRRVG